MPKSTKDSHTFVYYLTVSGIKKKLPSKSRSRSRSKIFTLTTFDGKCQNLQKTTTQFCASVYRFRNIKIKIFTIKKLVKVTTYNFSQLFNSMASVKIYKYHFSFFIFAKV